MDAVPALGLAYAVRLKVVVAHHAVGGALQVDAPQVVAQSVVLDHAVAHLTRADAGAVLEVGHTGIGGHDAPHCHVIGGDHEHLAHALAVEHGPTLPFERDARRANHQGLLPIGAGVHEHTVTGTRRLERRADGRKPSARTDREVFRERGVRDAQHQRGDEQLAH